MNVYPFIEAERAQQGNVKRACELFEVSRSAYYQHHAAGPSTRVRQDVELTEQIIEVHDASAGTYGSPRVHAELRAQGRRHSRKRIARLMQAAGRCGRAPKRWRTTTVPDPAAPARPDLIARDFTTAAAAVNTRWCGDITYINTWEGWLYLATVRPGLPSGRRLGHRRSSAHRPTRSGSIPRRDQPSPRAAGDLS
ncbi:IS3 family transposase [Micromonospora sp. NPDC005206]|uniref:IS3 family transposase n=1 Tax=Micromonospora sp. NPDC005206 TaxID=3157022 RepID=UPI00339FB1F7